MYCYSSAKNQYISMDNCNVDGMENNNGGRRLMFPVFQTPVQPQQQPKYDDISSISGLSKGSQCLRNLDDFFSSTPCILSPSQAILSNDTIRQDEPAFLTGPVTDRGESILKSLNILTRIQRLDKEKKRLGKASSGPQTKPKTLKKREGTSVEGAAFTFTNDMFNASNPKAFYHVMHFLFEILDPIETENLFRTSWPVYEKKQEQEFRRSAFNWTSKIVQENPEFFPDVNLQFSLFMTPGGDRCLRFLHFFIQFIMYTVAQQKKKKAGGSLLHNPKYNASSEEKQLQILKYEEERAKLLSRSTKTLEDTMKVIQRQDEKKVSNAKQNDEHVDFLLLENQKLLQIIEDKPHLFPENATELMEERTQKIKKEARKTKSRWDPTQCSISDDSLGIVLTKEWSDKLKEVAVNFKKVDEFCKKHAKLCKLVEAVETNGSVVLDGSKLIGLNKSNPDLGQYFQTVVKTIEDFCHEAEQLEKPSSELLDTIFLQQERESFLAYRKAQPKISESLSSSGLFENNSFTLLDEEQLSQDITFETKALQLKLDGVKWEALSKCDSHTSPETMFTWTPAKVAEFGDNVTALGVPLDETQTPKRRIDL